MKTLSTDVDHICFVLVEPSHPGNIGSAARAIKTMGFSDLRVVNPRNDDYRTHEEALAFATSSADVLARSQCFTSLSDALADVGLACALTGYSREYGAPLEVLDASCERAMLWLSANHQRHVLETKDVTSADKVAFVFGCERTGLSNEDVMLCHVCTAIATNPNCQSLNLAQAVQLVAYEMHRTLQKQAPTQIALYDWQDRFAKEAPASAKAVDGLIGHWLEAMTVLGVHNPDQPKRFEQMSRQIFMRTQLTQSEVDLLRGICSNIIRPKRERAGSKKPQRSR